MTPMGSESAVPNVLSSIAMNLIRSDSALFPSTNMLGDTTLLASNLRSTSGSRPSSPRGPVVCIIAGPGLGPVKGIKAGAGPRETVMSLVSGGSTEGRGVTS